ncbi:MAG: hypothetical protein AB9858_00990 [Acidaminococcaceae bacterium]
MKYKIEIIGATQSVERIMIVSREFEDGIKFIPLPFENEKEIQPILHNKKRKLDGCFFQALCLTLLPKSIWKTKTMYLIANQAVLAYI